MSIFNIYQGKKVLVTGHTGFKGSWMLKTLNILGAEVYGFSTANEYDQNMFDLLKLDKLCQKHQIGDIRNFDAIHNFIQEIQPDYIFHLAAQSLVRRSYKEPLYTFEVNTLGTIHILESIKSLPHRCYCICITTDKVYRNLEENRPYNEQDILGGHDPYSSSKAAAELAIASYRHSFFHPDNFEIHQKSIASVRAGNVIGGGDRCEDRLIPDLIKSIENDVPLSIRSPKAVRPWQHVLEPVFGYLLLGVFMYKDPIAYATAFNFGPEDEDAVTVEEIVKSAIQNLNKGSYQVEKQPDAPHEAHYLRLDISKVKKMMRWKPVFKVHEAVETTMHWYAHENKDSITNQQIEQYMRRFLSNQEV